MAVTDLSFTELENLFVSVQMPKFRAKQVRKWVYNRLATSFAEMTDLPSELRETMAKLVEVTGLAPVTTETSKDKQTVKVLFRLRDGNLIESVLMSYDPTESSRRRQTVCVSTQAGCGYGCAFCATGAGGLKRNLTSGEIVEQVLYFERFLRNQSKAETSVTPSGREISNVVFMGMGEPLANYNALTKAIETLNDSEGYNLGSRHMTVSTVGVVPGIAKLSREHPQVGLAVSLHAPNQKLREQIVPIAKRFPLPSLMQACKDYVVSTNRRVTFEYALAAGVNDSVENARELAELLKDVLCHVNLIPVNPHGQTGLVPSPAARIKSFQNQLLHKGIPVTVRVERGVDIQAACGQLRARTVGREQEPGDRGR